LIHAEDHDSSVEDVVWVAVFPISLLKTIHLIGSLFWLQLLYAASYLAQLFKYCEEFLIHAEDHGSSVEDVVWDWDLCRKSWPYTMTSYTGPNPKPHLQQTSRGLQHGSKTLRSISHIYCEEFLIHAEDHDSSVEDVVWDWDLCRKSWPYTIEETQVPIPNHIFNRRVVVFSMDQKLFAVFPISLLKTIPIYNRGSCNGKL
jgi:hypothetical protein